MKAYKKAIYEKINIKRRINQILWKGHNNSDYLHAGEGAEC